MRRFSILFFSSHTRPRQRRSQSRSHSPIVCFQLPRGNPTDFFFFGVGGGVAGFESPPGGGGRSGAAEGRKKLGLAPVFLGALGPRFTPAGLRVGPSQTPRVLKRSLQPKCASIHSPTVGGGICRPISILVPQNPQFFPPTPCLCDCRASDIAPLNQCRWMMAFR